MAFIGGAALLAGLLFGLVPAIGASRLAGFSWQTRTATASGRRHFNLRNAFITLQVVISLVLLVASGALVRAARTAGRVDPGFRTDHVLMASFHPGMAGYDATKASRFYQSVLDRVRGLPGVVAAGVTEFVPMGLYAGTTSLSVDGYEMPEDQTTLRISNTLVDPESWKVLCTPDRSRP